MLAPTRAFAHGAKPGCQDATKHLKMKMKVQLGQTSQPEEIGWYWS